MLLRLPLRRKLPFLLSEAFFRKVLDRDGLEDCTCDMVETERCTPGRSNAELRWLTVSKSSLKRGLWGTCDDSRAPELYWYADVPANEFGRDRVERGPYPRLKAPGSICGTMYASCEGVCGRAAIAISAGTWDIMVYAGVSG